MQVRDGKIQAPICPECGCRLINERALGRDDAWFHFFHPEGYTDMQGHKCLNIDFVWALEEGKLRVIYA